MTVEYSYGDMVHRSGSSTRVGHGRISDIGDQREFTMDHGIGERPSYAMVYLPPSYSGLCARVYFNDYQITVKLVEPVEGQTMPPPESLTFDVYGPGH